MRRKVYGQSQVTTCAICGARALSKTVQGLPSCKLHTKEELNLKCACGGWLDIKESKYGTFFVCMDCGPVSYSKGLNINDLPLKRVEDL